METIFKGTRGDISKFYNTGEEIGLKLTGIILKNTKWIIKDLINITFIIDLFLFW